MLACARIGAVHSVVFGGFAAHELAVRIDDARPKVVVATSCGIEVDRVVDYHPILDRRAGRGGARARALRDRAAPAASRAAAARPGPDLGRGHGGRRAGRLRAGRRHRPALHPLHLRHHRPARRAWCGTTAGTRSRCAGRCGTSTTSGRARSSGPPPTSAGWSATPTSSTRRCSPARTTVLYEGKPVGTPDAGAFWRVVAQHRVTALFTAPTAIRAIRRQDPDGALIARYDLTGLRTLFLAGERLDPDTYAWAGELLGVPVVDHWWQTETGWPVAAEPARPGAAADQARLAVGAGARATTCGSSTAPAAQVPAGTRRRDRDPAAAAARLPAHPVGATTSGTSASYLSTFPGYYLTGDGGPVRRRRLPLRDGPHRRRDQRGRAPAVHRSDGGGAGRATRRSPSAR